MSENDAATVIAGESNVMAARLLALRSALSLEVKGMKRRGRSVLSICRETEVQIDGEWVPLATKRTARAAYVEVNANIVKLFGEAFNRPLAG